MLLSSSDKAFIVEGTAEMIRSSGQTAKRFVPDLDAESLYGQGDEAFVFDSEFPFEFVETPVEILTSQKADAAVSVLPDQEVNEGDRLEFEGVKHKVLTVEAMNVFGAVSHKVLTLARLYEA